MVPDTKSLGNRLVRAKVSVLKRGSHSVRSECV